MSDKKEAKIIDTCFECLGPIYDYMGINEDEDGIKTHRASIYCVGNLRDRVHKLNQRIAELEEANRWIPVSERLPASGNIVNGWSGNFISEYLYQNGWRIYLEDEWMELARKNYPAPTHWMPLPQPPEEK